MPCLLPLSVSKTKERNDEETERRESVSEDRENMASEQSQGQLTLPSQPASSQPLASQDASQSLASQLGLLKKLKRQEKKKNHQKSEGSTKKIKEGKCSSQEINENQGQKYKENVFKRPNEGIMQAYHKRDEMEQ